MNAYEHTRSVGALMDIILWCVWTDGKYGHVCMNMYGLYTDIRTDGMHEHVYGHMLCTKLYGEMVCMNVYVLYTIYMVCTDTHRRMCLCERT